MNDWVLNSLLNIPGAQHVVLSSSDGIALGFSGNLPVDQAEKLAAAGVSLLSPMRAIAALHGTGQRTLRRVIGEFEGGLLFVFGAASGTVLMVLTGPNVDPALIGQETQQVIQRLGEVALKTPARLAPSALAPAPGGGVPGAEGAGLPGASVTGASVTGARPDGTPGAA
ncbi:roadblock/LC7 domain-containing protein [Actinomadura kijaniata]|uniref:roadblock/LC7 domain-containing protein n=1 Tax=Actinomadura kijaniata TaxID=46161 RepID=UPI003F1CB96F